MAMTSCPDCGNQVSNQATKCPHCGRRLRKPRRGFFGQLFKWAFILFNIAMIAWLISYFGAIANQYSSTASEAGRAGAAIGGTIGTGMLLGIWLIGDVILGLFVLFTRPRD